MKITCEACGAKYSIADEKVAGKAFKIQCKKCNASIVIHNEQQGVSETDDSSTELWHVVVDGEQQGPLSAQRVGQLIAGGDIDWDGYVWREGFDDWKVARDVQELVQAVKGSSSVSSQAAIQVGSSADEADLFDSDDEVTRAQSTESVKDIIASASKVTRASAAAGADLFSASPEPLPATAPAAQPTPSTAAAFSPFGSANGPNSAAIQPSNSESLGSAPSNAGDDNLIGARHENSVLFHCPTLKISRPNVPRPSNSLPP
ncbi:MAG: zinc-ribbon domain-containing protein [Myxococcales bacterium]|nr:MAG: zinc-ribbon domain-containing protein [Myxococcales bacterium]